MTGLDLADIRMANSNCTVCTGPPPDAIVHIPPPPIPAFLQRAPDSISSSDILPLPPHLNDSLCKTSCDWRSEGVQYIEMPQQGSSGPFFHDTWLLVLISSCIGVILIGIVLATMLLKCKFHTIVCSNSSNKGGAIQMPSTASSIQAKNGRIQNEAVLYPCTAESLQDSRVMWATLTPRGTMRHYLEDHTYETINTEQLHKHTCPAYTDPGIPPPMHTMSRCRDDKAFHNTAFVDYEEPLSIKTEYYQLNDVLEPNEPGIFEIQRGLVRPRISSPTRIENPNLPPLNIHPTMHKRNSRKNSGPDHTASTLLRNSITSTAYIPAI